MGGWTLDAPPGQDTSGWTVEPPPKKAAFLPVTDFHSAVDQTIGAGKWRPTGDYRTPQREDELRREGAATAKGPSAHSAGTPEAPGAHDIVIPGMSQAQGLAALKKLPGVKSVIYEGPAGGQGGHYHVAMDDVSGWKVDKPDPGVGWKVDPLPQKPGNNRVSSPHPPGVIDQAKTDFMAPIKEPAAALKKDFADQRSTPTGPVDFAKKALLDPLKELGDLGSLAMGALGGDLINTVSAPIERATRPAPTKEFGQKPGIDLGAAVAGLGPESGRLPKGLPPELKASAPAAAPQPRLQTLAERKVTAPKLSPEREGPILNDGPKDEPIKQTLTRHEDGLYRLQTGGDAAKIQAKRALGEVKEAPADRERLYHAIEERMVRPAGDGSPTFKTSKGSTYEVHPDGTTTRDKAYRPEHGRAEQGPQPRSADTFYVTEEEANKLAVIQARGGAKTRIARRGDHYAVQYVDGPDAGKFIRDTVVKPSRQPKTDLMPVELWNEGSRVHFGNKITEVGGGRDGIPPDLQEAYAKLKPRLEYQDRLRHEIKQMSPNALKDDEADQGDVTSSGYVHRVRADKPGLFGQGGERKDPITGGMIQRQPSGKSLSRQASSMKARKYFMLEDSEGNRTPAPKREKGDEGWTQGQTHRGTDGKDYTVKPATTLEIEGIDPEARYVKDPFVNTEWNILNLQRVKRNIEYMKAVIPDLADRDLAHREEWRYKDKDGKWQIGHSNAEIPPGFVEIPGIPELKGTYFHPRVANMFKDFANLPPDSDAARLLLNANRRLVGALFWNPIRHDFNIANMWTVGRGWDWVTPQGWKSLLTNGTRAIQSVLSQDDDYVRALNEGLPLQFSRAANADFYKLMIRKAGMEIEQNPTGWEKIAKDMGFKGAADLVANYYKEAQKAMWKAGDVMLMQRWFELMQNQGMSMEHARVQAGKEIADYRIPTEAFGSRVVSNVLNSKVATVFNNYHYGVFKAYASMIRDVVKGTAEERKQAAGRLFVLGVMAFAIAPVANKALQAATKNPRAKVIGAGLSAFPDRMIEVSQGQKEMADVVGSYITPAPAAETAFEWTFGRGKDWTGKDIIEPDASPIGKVAEGLEYAGSKVSPVQTAMEAAKPGSLEQTIATQLGIDLPSPRKVSGQQYAAQQRRKKAAKREAKDPLEHVLKGVLGQ